MLCSMGELEKRGFDEFEIHQYPKGVSLILKCADWITNKELDVALNYARKIAKNKPYRVFIKVKDSLGYKVLEVMDIIDIISILASIWVLLIGVKFQLIRLSRCKEVTV